MHRTVVLVHGLNRTGASMLPIAAALRFRGVETLVWSYRARAAAIADHATALHETLAPLRRSGHVIDFVTHSLGGVIVRKLLADHPSPLYRRAVMIAPPNRGSEVADRMMQHGITRLFLGKAGAELGTGAESTPNSLGPIPCEAGVIAGSGTVNPVLSSLFEGPNDGKVAVERTRVEGMRDFLLLPRSHTFIIWSPEAIAQTLHFLECGAFMRAA